MTDEIRLDALPSAVDIQLPPRGYGLWGATAGALTYGALTEAVLLVVAGATVGLYLLGELHAVTHQLRAVTGETSVAVEPSSEPDQRRAIELSVAATEGLDALERLRLRTETATLCVSEEGTAPLSATVPIERPRDELEVSLRARQSSPTNVYSMQLTLVDASVPSESVVDPGPSAANLRQKGDQRDGNSDPGPTTSDRYRGLREYTPTDSFADVDWKASARRETLQVRERADEDTAGRALLLDLGGLDPAAWHAGATVATEWFERVGRRTTRTVGILDPTGETRVYREAGATNRVDEFVTTAIDDIASAANGAVQSRPAEPCRSPQVLPASTVGEVLRSFRRDGTAETPPLLQGANRLRTRVPRLGSVVVVTGTETPARTLTGVRSIYAEDVSVGVELLLGPAQAASESELWRWLEEGTPVTLSRRPLRRKQVDRAAQPERERKLEVARRGGGPR